MSEPLAAGWHRDPFGRYEKRYHTGTGWTEHVKNKGKAAIDPPQARLGHVAPAPRVANPTQTPTPIQAAPNRPAPIQAAPIQAAPPIAAPAPAPTPPTPARVATPTRVLPPGRGPAPTPVRAGVPAASRSSVAVAYPPTANRRAASSYLKPALKVSPEPERAAVRWPWVLVAILGLVVVLLATGFGVINGNAEEKPKALPIPARAPHTITDVAYNFVSVGTTRDKVINGLGKEPASGAEYQRVFPVATTNPSCAYYYGALPRISYSFCFDKQDNLVAKTTRSLPVAAGKPSPKDSAKADATS